MALPQFTIRDMLEAGVHFGHQTHRWNPKMSQYIYGSRNGIHILDLRQSVPMMYQALGFLRQTVAGGGRVLFVGSKRQAQELVAEAAARSGQYYVNHRWLGGMLTNWKTISNSIRRLKQLEDMFNSPRAAQITKKEMVLLRREHEKLQRALNGIKDMGGLPDALFVVDTIKEDIAIAEANKLGIPVVAILDSNSNPQGVDFPIPGNDDSTRALRLYTRLAADAILDGISTQLAQAGALNKGEKGEPTVERKRTVVNLSPKAKAAREDEKTATADTAEATASAAAAAAAQV